MTRLYMISEEKYLFWVTLFFFVALLVINPSNKIIALSFGLLFIVYYIKLRKVDLSLLFVFIASLIVGTGKTYPILLFPPGIFPLEVFPRGYFVNLVITPAHVIAFIMLIFLIREIVLKRKQLLNLSFKWCLMDILLALFYVFKIASALFGSQNPELSLPFEILSLGGLVLYFYVRVLINPDGKFWRYLASIFAALVVFESVLALSQLAIKSPLYKNLESQVNIEYFGQAVDEPEFTFRPVGTLDHANALGISLASTLIFLWAFVWEGKSNIFWLTFVLGFIVLVTTLSRSAWLGFVLGMVLLKPSLKYLIGKVWKLRFFIIPLAIILFFIFVLPRLEKSVYSFGSDAGAMFFRNVQIRDALEIIKLHPIFGVGAVMSVYEGVALNLYSAAAGVPLAVHNWYIQTCLENGLPALMSFILFVLLSIRTFRSSSPIYLGIIAAIVCLLTAGLFQPYLNESFIFLSLGALNSGIMGGGYGKKN